MIALVVRIDIVQDHVDEFMKAMLIDARGAAEDEPGCRSFNVVQSQEEPSTIFLFEVYDDQAALDAHRAAPHYKQWRETVKDWFANPPVVEQCVTVFPDEATLRGGR